VSRQNDEEGKCKSWNAAAGNSEFGFHVCDLDYAIEILLGSGNTNELLQ
jgi:hypothetical protein